MGIPAVIYTCGDELAATPALARRIRALERAEFLPQDSHLARHRLEITSLRIEHIRKPFQRVAKFQRVIAVNGEISLSQERDLFVDYLSGRFHDHLSLSETCNGVNNRLPRSASSTKNACAAGSNRALIACE